MRKTIREQEPIRPEHAPRDARRRGTHHHGQAPFHCDTSKLIHQLKGDLDWIVMKCLEKDRTRRYETANGLAADLKRHLDSETVTAGPPGAIYALRKFAARNRWPVIFSATAAVLIFAGLIGTSVGLGRANKARIQADQNAARATQLAEKAKKAEASALQEKEVALGLAYSASMLGACDALQNAQIDAVRHYLSIAPSDLRGWEWRVLFEPAGHEHPRPETLSTAGVKDPCSPGRPIVPTTLARPPSSAGTRTQARCWRLFPRIPSARIPGSWPVANK